MKSSAAATPSERRHNDRRAPGFGAGTQRTFYAVLILLIISGAVWLVAHYWPQYLGEYIGDWCDPWLVESWSMKLHGAVAMLAMFGLGTIFHSHLRAAWRQQRNHISGLVMASTLLLLIISGYGLYYFTDDARQWSEWTHWATGFGLPVLLLAHSLIGRRSR